MDVAGEREDQTVADHPLAAPAAAAVDASLAARDVNRCHSWRDIFAFAPLEEVVLLLVIVVVVVVIVRVVGIDADVEHLEELREEHLPRLKECRRVRVGGSQLKFKQRPRERGRRCSLERRQQSPSVGQRRALRAESSLICKSGRWLVREAASPRR